MRQVVDMAMERFLRSQQMHQKFQLAKPELLEDLAQIVSSIEALKAKIVGLNIRKDGNDQSVLFSEASQFHACLQVNKSNFERLLEEDSEQWCYQANIANERLGSLVSDFDTGFSQHLQ